MKLATGLAPNPFPTSTGLAARLCGTTEPKLTELVRRGHIDPPPNVVAGRRLWTCAHVRQAAVHLGTLTESLERLLEEGDDQ